MVINPKTHLTSSVEAALEDILVVLVHSLLAASVVLLLAPGVDEGLCRARDREMRRMRGVDMASRGRGRRMLGEEVGPGGRGRRMRG